MALEEVAKFFGNIMVYEVEQINLESLQLSLAKRFNAATVNRKFNVIKNFFRKSVEWKYLRENPSTYIQRLKVAPKQKQLLTNDQVVSIITCLPTWAKNAFFFIARTGVRRGQLCDLTWDKVDFERRSICFVSEKGGVVRSNIIPMTEELFSFIHKLANENQLGAKSKFVFTSAKGCQIERNKFSKVVTNAGTKIGITNAGLHVLRHTLLTGMSLQNQSGSAIQKIAGHSALTTTQKYIHLNDDNVRMALEDYAKSNVIQFPVAN